MAANALLHTAHLTTFEDPPFDRLGISVTCLFTVCKWVMGFPSVFSFIWSHLTSLPWIGCELPGQCDILLKSWPWLWTREIMGAKGEPWGTGSEYLDKGLRWELLFSGSRHKVTMWLFVGGLNMFLLGCGVRSSVDKSKSESFSTSCAEEWQSWWLNSKSRVLKLLLHCSHW